MTPYAPYLRLMRIIVVAAVLGLLMDYRFYRAGEWLPPIPASPAWSVVDSPWTDEVDVWYGHAKHVSRIYTSPFGERVDAMVVAAGSIDAYHEPTICAAGSGWNLTAERLVPISGPDTKVRAMVLRHRTQRIIMYYWLENRDGGLATEGGFYANHDIVARLGTLRTVYGATIAGRQTCVIRVYAMVPPGDESGVQTRRN